MKTLILTSAILLSVLMLNAQSWVAPGATWNYRIKVTQYPQYDLKFVVTSGGTVTIMNKVCDSLIRRQTGTIDFGGGPLPWNTTYYDFMYIQNNVLYKYDGISRFDTIVNYNAVPGQSWYVAGWDRDSTNCKQFSISPQKVTVVDTGYVSINSLSLRSLTVTSGVASPTTKYVERIGAVDFDMDPYYCCHVDCGYHMQFSCYWDDNFAPVSMNGWTDCSFFVSTEEHQPLKRLTIHPNPSTGVFNLDISEKTHVRIYSLTGLLIFESDFSGTGKSVIDLSMQPKGIYYLVASNAKGSEYLKMCKE